MQSLVDQIISFLLVTLLGMALGFLFDCYCTIRQIWQPKDWGTILGDIFFWFFATLLSYAYLLFANYGEVRLYVFLALAGGALLYCRLFSKKVRSFLLRSYIVFRRFFTGLIKLLFIPLRFLWKTVTFPFRVIFMLVIFILKGCRQMKNILLQALFFWQKKDPPLPPAEKC